MQIGGGQGSAGACETPVDCSPAAETLPVLWPDHGQVTEETAVLATFSGPDTEGGEERGVWLGYL